MKSHHLISASLVIVLILLAVSCSDQKESDANPVGLEEITDIAGTTETDATDPQRIADQQMDEAAAKTATVEIDTSQYPIHIRDSYIDYFYLTPIPNLSNIPANYYAYTGYFVHCNVEYDASIIYYQNTKTFAATLFYINNQCMIYHCHWNSYNYFRGTYAWVKPPTPSFEKQRPISCTIVKGCFPGMND